MRFGAVAILGLMLLMAVTTLAIAIDASVSRDETSDVHGIPGSGSIFEIQVGPDNCLKIGFEIDDAGYYCLEDVEEELPPEMMGTIARQPAEPAGAGEAAEPPQETAEAE
ncbi:MAG: hypothetical protein QF717_09575 [SAR202 cluster bacterium]|nr:hypothetical protein [SAR202 cluster bacterium]HJO81797.1 hypothetical protein [SAR202 cluster bacterium]